MYGHVNVKYINYCLSPTCFGPYCAIFRNFLKFVCPKLLLHFMTTMDCNFTYSNQTTMFVSFNVEVTMLIGPCATILKNCSNIYFLFLGASAAICVSVVAIYVHCLVPI